MQTAEPSTPEETINALSDAGWSRIHIGVTPTQLAELAERAFAPDAAGTRCLLDLPVVREATERMRETLIAAGVLPRGAVAIQAIAFDKNPAANWKVTWHQDVMFPFTRAVTATGYEIPSRKDGVDYARPPRAVLETLLAVRLHIDDCDETNGPLRVAPGSHREGICEARRSPTA